MTVVDRRQDSAVMIDTVIESEIAAVVEGS